jgi:RNA polymerase sigma-70 factor (ECF subfamily)
MSSFEEIYATYSPDVYRFAFWLAADSNEAEDITSETFVRAWINFGSIRTETLKAYLFTIARNIHLESFRKYRNHAPLEEQIADIQPHIEKKLEHRNELEFVRNQLLSLPEVDRSAFVMRVQHELSYAEIARVLQLSETSIKVKVHRVRKKLFAARLNKESS